MSGKFEGLTDIQWQLISPLFPKKEGVGRPYSNFRYVLNTVLYVEISGCRWCDVPVGSQWGKRSTSHKWLGRLQDLGVWVEKLTA